MCRCKDIFRVYFYYNLLSFVCIDISWCLFCSYFILIYIYTSFSKWYYLSLKSLLSKHNTYQFTSFASSILSFLYLKCYTYYIFLFVFTWLTYYFFVIWLPLFLFFYLTYSYSLRPLSTTTNSAAVSALGCLLQSPAPRCDLRCVVVCRAGTRSSVRDTGDPWHRRYR